MTSAGDQKAFDGQEHPCISKKALQWLHSPAVFLGRFPTLQWSRMPDVAYSLEVSECKDKHKGVDVAPFLRRTRPDMYNDELSFFLLVDNEMLIISFRGVEFKESLYPGRVTAGCSDKCRKSDKDEFCESCHGPIEKLPWLLRRYYPTQTSESIQALMKEYRACFICETILHLDDKLGDQNLLDKAKSTETAAREAREALEKQLSQVRQQEKAAIRARKLAENRVRTCESISVKTASA